MNYQKAKFILILITMMLIVGKKTYSQSSCDATIHAIDSIFQQFAFQQNKTSGHSDSEIPSDTLKFKVVFTFDTFGVFKNIKVKKLKCVKCKEEDKKYFSDEIVKFILSVKGVKPCVQPLKFKLPVRYILYN
jgi:hypothetical protein